MNNIIILKYNNLRLVYDTGSPVILAVGHSIVARQAAQARSQIGKILCVYSLSIYMYILCIYCLYTAPTSANFP